MQYREIEKNGENLLLLNSDEEKEGMLLSQRKRDLAFFLWGTWSSLDLQLRRGMLLRFGITKGVLSTCLGEPKLQGSL